MKISTFGWGWSAGIIAAVLGDTILTVFGYEWPVLLLSIVLYFVIYAVFFKLSGGFNERP